MPGCPSDNKDNVIKYMRHFSWRRKIEDVQYEGAALVAWKNNKQANK
jgi:hypothetical protein